MRVEPLEALTHYQWLPGAGVLMKCDLWRRAENTAKSTSSGSATKIGISGCGQRKRAFAPDTFRNRSTGTASTSKTCRLPHRGRPRQPPLPPPAAPRVFRRARSGAAFPRGRFLAGCGSRPPTPARHSFGSGTRALLLDGDWRQARRLAQNDVSMLLPKSVRNATQTMKAPLKSRPKPAPDARSSSLAISRDSSPRP